MITPRYAVYTRSSMACSKRDDLILIAQNSAAQLGVDKNSLKNQQLEAIVSILEGKDTFVNLPTGFGKSLIYQCLPLCTTSTTDVCGISSIDTSTTGAGSANIEAHGIVVVISPLTSLINEQVSFLKDRGVPAINLATLTPEEKELAQQGFLGVVFSSPEYLLGSGSEFVSHPEVQKNLIAICVDESHCVVKWGQNSPQFAAFRESYGRIAELRSVVPQNVPLLALTATASLQAREEIVESLGMCAPVMILESPEKLNIRYSHVATSFREDNPTIFKCFADELEMLGQNVPRTIIFCRTHRQVRIFYSYFKGILPTEPMTMVAMFHSTTEESRKDFISESFQSPDGIIRILLCTIAFGMGVNVKNVTRVVHFGPPESVDDYVQESGRAGRDGEQSYAILVTYRGCTRHKVSAQMKEYIQNTGTCRRKLLLQPFGTEVKGPAFLHNCCEVCAKICKCSDDGLHCNDEHKGASGVEGRIATVAAKNVLAKLVVRDVQQEQLNQLEELLVDYQSKLQSATPESEKLLCGDVTVGFPKIVIDWILRDVRFIDSADYLNQNYPFFSSEYSADVWEILCRTVGPPSQQTSLSYMHEEEDSNKDSDVDSESSLEDMASNKRFRAVVLHSSESE